MTMKEEYQNAFDSEVSMLLKDTENNCSSLVIASDVNHLNVLTKAFHDHKGQQIWHQLNYITDISDHEKIASKLKHYLHQILSSF